MQCCSGEFGFGSMNNLLMDCFSLFSSPVCLILYWCCKEKFCFGHQWVSKGMEKYRTLASFNAYGCMCVCVCRERIQFVISVISKWTSLFILQFFIASFFSGIFLRHPTTSGKPSCCYLELLLLSFLSNLESSSLHVQAFVFFTF